MTRKGASRPASRAVVFGWHTVAALLEHHPERVLAVHVQKNRDDARVRRVLESVERHGIALRRHARAEFDRLYPDAVHQGAAAEVRPAEPRPESALDALVEAAARPLLLVLDGVQDPHNLGACLRTAEAAGALAVVAPKDRAAGLTPAVRKVASGAAELIPFIQVVNVARALARLQVLGVWAVGAAGAAPASVYDARLDRPLALVLGAEGGGLRRLTRERCDELVHIPMPGRIESLNVSVAAGVCLFEALRQRLTK